MKSAVWPATPSRFAENPPDLLTALRDASCTTAQDSGRYAMRCIQLRGQHGDLLATDGRQALVQSGFSFPWDEDLLLPGNRVFGSKLLSTDEGVFIGQVDDSIVLRSGPWTIWWAIEKNSRFPNIDSQIRQPDTATASCRIPDSDRRFLIDNLRRLPANDTQFRAVTVDLNGSIAIRGKQPGLDSVTEMILSSSTRDGKPIRVNTDRRYLQRAAELGFEQLHVFNLKSPVLACDDRRKFIWMLLEPGSTIAPTPDAVRIESQPVAPTEPENPPSRRSPVTSKADRAPRTAPTQQNGEQELDPITAAEQLRDSLRNTLQSTTTLVRTLKQHRKRNKAVESTLHSLRQLQAIDA